MTMQNESPAPGTPQLPRRNVELVKQIYDALKRRNLDEVFTLLAPDVDVYQSSEVPWGGSYKGQQELRGFFEKLTKLINSTVVIERFIDAGENVVAIGRTQGAVNSSGNRYDVPIAHVWTVRSGTVVRVQYFIDNPTMLSALS